MTRLSGSLPKGVRNGLDHLAPKLLGDPTAPRLLIVSVDCLSETTNHDTGEVVPTARVLAVEAVAPRDVATVEAAMHHARDLRTGDAPALAFDPVTGEVSG